MDHENSPRLIRAYNPKTGRIATIGRIGGQLVYGTPSLSISPDRRFILFAQQENSGGEIMALRR